MCNGKVFVFQFSKPFPWESLGETIALTQVHCFLCGYKYESANVSVVRRFWLTALVTFPEGRWSEIETTGCQRDITENVRIYICTPHKTRSFYNGAPMGPRGPNITVCACVCVWACMCVCTMDFQLQISLLSAVWGKTPMGTSEEKAISTISQRTKYQNYAFWKTSVSDGNTRTCAILHKRTHMHTQTYTSTRTHAITEHGRGLQYFPSQPD